MIQSQNPLIAHSQRHSLLQHLQLHDNLYNFQRPEVNVGVEIGCVKLTTNHYNPSPRMINILFRTYSLIQNLRHGSFYPSVTT